MKYRLKKTDLIDILSNWNHLLRRKIRLVACGGTALTLLNVKESTKDVDFIVPDLREYTYLISTLKDLGYVNTRGQGWQKPGDIFIFDLFPGKKIHTTELLVSPLSAGQHSVYEQLSRIDILILNDYDLISSKLMRGTSLDFEDCLTLLRAHKDTINIDHLRNCFNELIQFDIAEDRIKNNIETLIERLNRGDENG
ncbi:hypothetical protein ACFL49_01635 [Candidatus Omnitrophota bacterium]